MTSFELDEVDRALIEELRLDGRRPVADLARRLDMPRTTVQHRLDRLLAEGVIERFEPVLDHDKLGRPVTAWILVAFQPGPGISQKRLAGRILDLPGVAEVHLISGEWDLLTKVHGESIESIGDLVVEELRNMEGVGSTVTCATFHSVYDRPR